MSKELIRTIKFTLFSISAGIIQTVTFIILNEFVTSNYWISYLTALTLSVLWNFTLNRKVTFKSATNVPIAMFKVFIFYLIFTPVTTIGGDYLTKIGINEYIVLIGTMVLNFVTEYLYDRFYVFGNSIDTLKKKK